MGWLERTLPSSLSASVRKLLPAPLKTSIRKALASRWFSGVDDALARQAANRVKADRGDVTVAALRADVSRLMIPQGAIVFVHSSLSSLGFIEGGAASVVDVLIEVVVRDRGGTLAMPTFTSLRDGQVFDARSSPSQVGAVTEVFRQRSGVVRSVHPTHSVAALGERAEWLTSFHHRCGTTFGPGSPLGRLFEAGGYLLGLGVSLGPVTFYHVLEDHRADFPLSVYTADSPMATLCLDADGSEQRLSVTAHDPIVSATRIDRPAGTFIRAYVTRDLERCAGLRWFEVGHGRAWVIAADRMYREIEALMERGITIYSTREQVIARDATAVEIGAAEQVAQHA
jgi:aminoglycoside 3-N-acetyltransferase